MPVLHSADRQECLSYLMHRAIAVAVRMQAWFQHHLDAAIILLFERAVGIRGFFETDAVRNHKRRINLTELYQLEQLRHVFVHVGLTHLEGQPFGKGRTEWELIEK